MSAPIGLFPGIPYEVYVRWPALRASYLRHFKRSPRHAREQYLRPAKPSKAMELGTAIHAAILEPGDFEKRYAQRPEGVDRRFTEGKAVWAAFEAASGGKTILSADDYDTAVRVRESVWAEPWAEALLGGKGSAELTAGWIDAEWQVACKGRIDRYCAEFNGLATVVDLKSTRDAGEESFRADIERFGYGLQAAFYLDGLAALSSHFRQWIWLAVETSPPYAAALYLADDEILAEGRRLYRTAIGLHLECEREGYWPGYPARPRIISRPPWARRPQEDASL
jgi:hypothetical protein